MRVLLPPLDLPRDESEALQVLEEGLASLGPDEGVFVLWRRDLRSLLPEAGPWRWWPAVDGPSAWHFLVHRRGPEPRRWGPTAAVRLGWKEAFRLFRDACHLAGLGDRAALEAAAEFQARVTEELDREEEWLLPLYQERTGDARSPRELGYERLGVRRGLDRFPGLLGAVLGGEAGRREMERFEIDVFHLMEHHVQRLEASVLPLLELTEGPAMRREPASG